MVSTPHETRHRIFRHDPSLLADLYESVGIRIGRPHTVTVLNSDLTEIAPLERRVDTAMMVAGDDGKHLVVIESQTADFVNEFVDIGLAGTDAQQLWRKNMRMQSFYPHRRTLYTEWAEEGREEGIKEGIKEGSLRAEAQSVLEVLGARGFAVGESISERVLACTDHEQLRTLLHRAATTREAEQIFAAAD